MKIKFLGTCGAWRPAELFHNDGNLEKLINAKKLHLRSQLLINDDMLVDFPEDTYFKILEYGFDASAIESILITHSHSDHFYPADMSLRGGAYAHEMTVPEVNVYGDKNVFDTLTSRKLSHDTYNAVEVFAFKSFKAGKYTVTPLPAVHDPLEDSFIYLIDDGKVKLLYATDTQVFPKETFDYLATVVHIDAILYDCTSYTNGPMDTHMWCEENVKCTEILKGFGVVDSTTKIYPTHLCADIPFRTDNEDVVVKYGYTAIPYDGMEAEI